MSRQPLIGVTACSKQIGLQPYHVAGDKYVRAVVVGATGMPVIIPAMADAVDLALLLEHLDGLLLTGSPSNVEPRLYQGPASAPGTAHDPARDAITLPLIQAALEAGVPLLGICRGFQEINVALGGSLHQSVHSVAPYQDHREPKDQPLEVQYAPRHAVRIEPGGVLAGLGLVNEIQVNSIHAQGVDRLAPGLRVEARAADGLIEAFSVEAARSFAVGVQWHPEWQVQANPASLALFQAFGRACRARAQNR